MPRAAVGLSVAFVVAGALVWFVPWLTRDRPAVVGVEGTTPIFEPIALVELGPGQEACLHRATVEPTAERLGVTVGTFGEPGPPLDATLTGRGYVERTRLPGGYRDLQNPLVPIDPPSRTLLARVCIENAGTRPVALYGTTEPRTQARAETFVDGKPVPQDLALAFYRAEPRSILERVPLIFERMGFFHPALMGTWLAWVLVPLLLIGMPLLLLWALRRAFAASALQRPRGPEHRDVVERRADEARVDA